VIPGGFRAVSEPSHWFGTLCS